MAVGFGNLRSGGGRIRGGVVAGCFEAGSGFADDDRVAGHNDPSVFVGGIVFTVRESHALGDFLRECRGGSWVGEVG